MGVLQSMVPAARAHSPHDVVRGVECKHAVTVAARNSGPCVLWNNLGNCEGGPAIAWHGAPSTTRTWRVCDNRRVWCPPDGFILGADEGRGGACAFAAS